MKEKLPVIIGIIIFLGLCGLFYYYMEYGKDFYYTKVDNTKLEKLISSDMQYEYTLISYNKTGRKKEIKFKTSRKLKENAYLKLEVLSISGVHSWEEVSYEELPEKIKLKYSG